MNIHAVHSSLSIFTHLALRPSETRVAKVVLEFNDATGFLPTGASSSSRPPAESRKRKAKAVATPSQPKTKLAKK